MGLKYIELEQDSPEWHELRRNKIGASDVAAILGISPYTTSRDLALIKLGLLKKDSNEYMQRGKDLEPIARAKFIEMTGIHVEPKVIRHPKYEWAMCSLDGISSDEQTIVEIKCNGKKNHELAKQDIIPEYYKCQMQFQMECTNNEVCHYMSFVNEKDCYLSVCYRNKTFINEMMTECEKFWTNLQNFIIPEEPYEERDDDIWHEHAAWFRETRDKRIHWEKMEEEAKDNLIGLAHGKDCRGAGVSLSRCFRQGNIQYKDIPELKDLDLSKYRTKITEYWRIA